MTHIQANFTRAMPLEGSLLADLLADGMLAGGLKAHAARDWSRASLERTSTHRPFGIEGEQGKQAVTVELRSAGIADDKVAEEDDADIVTPSREDAIRLLTLHAGSCPWQPMLRVAVGLAFAAWAMGVAADLGVKSVERPHYTSIEPLPSLANIM